MTIIAADITMMAGDRQITDEQGIKTFLKMPKIRRFHGCIVGVAGDADACQDILHADAKLGGSDYLSLRRFTKDLTKSLAPDADISMLILAKSVWSYEAGVLLEHNYFAIGSGSQIAIGAMAAGKSPYDACQIAIDWTSGCGGDIDVIAF